MTFDKMVAKALKMEVLIGIFEIDKLTYDSMNKIVIYQLRDIEFYEAKASNVISDSTNRSFICKNNNKYYAFTLAY